MNKLKKNVKSLVPIKIYSNLLLAILSPFMKVIGVSIFPFIVMRKEFKNPFTAKDILKKEKLIMHETIHFKQQLELLIIPFYIFYIGEFIVRFIIHRNFKKAYKKISFEQEANNNEEDFNYLEKRKLYSWVKFF
jgi:hypothetical protein